MNVFIIVWIFTMIIFFTPIFLITKCIEVSSILYTKFHKKLTENVEKIKELNQRSKQLSVIDINDEEMLKDDSQYTETKIPDADMQKYRKILKSPTEWFSSILIDDYLEIIHYYSESKKKKISFISISFHVHLVSEAEGKYIAALSIFNYRYKGDKENPGLIFIPFWKSGHFRLLVINGSVIEYYDSVSWSWINYDACNKIINFLHTIDDFKDFQFKIERKNVPDQGNNNDCGLCVCLNARRRIASENFTYSSKNFPNERLKILKELEVKRLLYRVPGDD